MNQSEHEAGVSQRMDANHCMNRWIAAEQEKSEYHSDMVPNKLQEMIDWLNYTMLRCQSSSWREEDNHP